MPTPVLRREGVAAGTERDGPLIVESMDSTVVVPPAWRLAARDGGLLELVRREEA